mmetsp:Transcript_21465/g.61281  ORF Transcript_21465/g.61281 Transcript_21465/m.61281 type:complete len:279 (-) Transcript_21465:752-1588(-)
MVHVGLEARRLRVFRRHVLHPRGPLRGGCVRRQDRLLLKVQCLMHPRERLPARRLLQPDLGAVRLRQAARRHALRRRPRVHRGGLVRQGRLLREGGELVHRARRRVRDAELVLGPGRVRPAHRPLQRRDPDLRPAMQRQQRVHHERVVHQRHLPRRADERAVPVHDPRWPGPLHGPRRPSDGPVRRRRSRGRGHVPGDLLRGCAVPGIWLRLPALHDLWHGQDGASPGRQVVDLPARHGPRGCGHRRRVPAGGWAAGHGVPQEGLRPGQARSQRAAPG